MCTTAIDIPSRQLLEFRLLSYACCADQSIVLTPLARELSVALERPGQVVYGGMSGGFFFSWFFFFQAEALTFVFFIRHLSQAFHTLLCLPSGIECAEWLSVGDMGEWRWG